MYPVQMVSITHYCLKAMSSKMTSSVDSGQNVHSKDGGGVGGGNEEPLID